MSSFFNKMSGLKQKHTVLLLSLLLITFSVYVNGCALLQSSPTPPTFQQRLELAAAETLFPLEKLGATVAVEVTTINGDLVFDHNRFQLMVPASIQKLAVAADAFYNVPLDFCWETSIKGYGALDSSGTLAGNLVISGSWDPALSGNHPYVEYPWTHVKAWAEILQSQGLRHVDGALVGTGTKYQPGGWELGDRTERYAPVVSQLSWNDGLNITEPVPVEDPRLLALEAFSTALDCVGITSSDSFVVIDSVYTDSVESTIGLVHRSAPLDSIVSPMISVSSNLWAELISAKIEEYTGNSGSYSPGWLNTLKNMGVYCEGIRLADACGMARRNNMSAHTATDLLLKSYSMWGERWVNLLPFPGEEYSSLQHRLVKYPNRIRAKTGSMSRNRSLAGYIMDDNNPVIVFCIIVNNCPVLPTEYIDGFTQAIVDSWDQSKEAGFESVVWR